jgi:hypothetical protein
VLLSRRLCTVPSHPLAEVCSGEPRSGNIFLLCIDPFRPRKRRGYDAALTDFYSSNWVNVEKGATIPFDYFKEFIPVSCLRRPVRLER